jgi:hypothetical protein
VWAASTTLRIGDVYVGVRSDPAELSNHLRRALARHVVEGVHAPPNYSVRLENRDAGHPGPVRAYVLYRSQCLLLRTRTRNRLMRALVRSLESHLGVRHELVRLRQLAVVGPTEALILPHELFWRLEAMEPRLHAHGMWLVDPPFVDIDVSSRTLVLAQPTVDEDDRAIAAGPDPHPSRGRVGPVPGRYPIREWAILRSDEGGTPTAREALGTLLPLLDPEIHPSDAIEAMAHVLSATRLSSIGHEPTAQMFEWIVGDES